MKRARARAFVGLGVALFSFCPCVCVCVSCVRFLEAVCQDEIALRCSVCSALYTTPSWEGKLVFRFVQAFSKLAGFDCFVPTLATLIRNTYE